MRRIDLDLLPEFYIMWQIVQPLNIHFSEFVQGDIIDICETIPYVVFRDIIDVNE